MDNLTSPPETLEETVTDIDLLFVGGLRETITLLQGDLLRINQEALIIDIASPKESIVYYKRHVIGTRIRERVLRRVVKPAIDQRTKDHLDRVNALNTLHYDRDKDNPFAS